MPYQIRKLPTGKYRVTNKKTGQVTAKSTTKQRAEGQVRILERAEKKMLGKSK